MAFVLLFPIPLLKREKEGSSNPNSLQHDFSARMQFQKMASACRPFLCSSVRIWLRPEQSRAVVLVVVALLALRVKTIPHELVGPLVVLEQ